MKQGFYNKNNTLKTKTLRLILLVFLAIMGGMEAWAWKPTSPGTYRLRSRGASGNNFDVYNAAGTSTVATNQSAIEAFNITSGTYRLIFENTRTIKMTGQIAITAPVGTQAHLIMELGAPPSGTIANTANNPTLKVSDIPNTNSQKMAFYITKKDNPDRTQHTITIRGNAAPTGTENISEFNYNFANNFVIDGSGPKLEPVDENTMMPKVKATARTSDDKVVESGMFRIQEGSLTLENVTFQYFSSKYTNANLIQVFPDAGDAGVKIDIDHCYFYQIGGRSNTGSPVIRMQANNANVHNINRNAVIQNCKFDQIFGSRQLAVGQTTVIDNGNGTIRTIGNNKTTLGIYNTHITNNYGCAVRWHGAMSNSKLEVHDCLIENNFTCLDDNTLGGGGLLLKGPAEIRNTTIRNNRTQGDGGGIYLSTYTDFGNGNPALIPDHSVLDLDDNTLITDNVALRNGGGVAIDGIRMKNHTHDNLNPINPETGEYLNGPNGYLWYAPDGQPFTLGFKLNGATITDNEAQGKYCKYTYVSSEIHNLEIIDNPSAAESDTLGYGGGVFIRRNDKTTYFKIDCLLDKGEITNNRAATSTKGKGGGVAIFSPNTFSNPTDMPDHVTPQNVEVTIGVSGATASDQVLIKDNWAVDGGGVYVSADTINYNNVTSRVFINVYDYSLIDNNTATTGSGGGIYLANGLVTITNKSVVGAYSPTIQRNKANDNAGLGGGVYLGNGDIIMEGATIGGDADTLGNLAGLSGGGLYVNNGSVTMLSTTIRYNQATSGSGGGMYVGDGNVSINPNEIGTGFRSNISDNTAGLHGGGIYTANGRLIAYGSSSGTGYDNKTQIQINNNKATSGNGGGIYCQGNPSSAEYDIILRRVKVGNNTAGISGGGIYLNAGKISVSNGVIDGNIATNHGGGVYTLSGNIDINVTKDEIQPSRIINNTANLNGGGLNTHHGYIRVFGNNDNNRIPIANNLATTGSGGGVFCMGESASNQYITIQHADLINNKAVNGGGNAGTNVVAGSGGGIYLQTGKIAITKVNIQNNFAKNDGGGIYDHEGDIEVEECIIGSSPCESGDYYYKDGITYDPDSNNNDTDRGNLASTNGGGIYTQSGNVRITESSVQSNKANEHGGGIYLKLGTIFTHASNINFNIANINGGGIVNHEGKVYAYGCGIGGNTAKTGSGGGIYILKGDITTGPCIDPDVTTKSRATVIKDNKANLNGGGINLGDINDPEAQGNIFLNGDQVLDNVAETGNGGGIYISDGVIDLYGGKIERNFSNEGDGGGIWSGGGSFFINRRQGKPVVEVISIDSITNTTASIHYHVIDKGGTDTTAITGHGIYWGTSTPSTEVPYNPAAATHYSGLKHGCYYITISGLNAGTTYYVKAFATNTMHLEDFSDSVAFSTRNDKLVVQPKNYNEITATQANISDGSEGTSSMSTLPTPRPRDIYPAPAREPWDWDDYDEVVIASEAKQSSNTTEWIVTACGLAMTGNDIVAKNDTMNNVRALCDSDTIYPPIDVPLIQYNRAFEGSGGGIYMTNSSPTPTRLVFSGGEADSIKGKIIYNYAKDAGGGVYIDSNAYMQMKGYCEVNANWVPNGKHGGGIYLAGRLYVGENRDDVNKHALQVSRNFALNDYNGTAIDPTEDEPAGITALLNKDKLNYTQKLMRNNIMLPRNTYDFETTKDSGGDNQSTVITLLSDISAKDASGKTYTNMGFSVNNGFCPVVSTSKDFGEDYLNQNETIDGWPFCKYEGTDSNPEAIVPTPTYYYEKWLHDLMPQGDALTLSDDGSIFEDTETYIAIHTDFNNQPFRVKYIYLWGSWTNPAVSIDPEINQPMYNGSGPGDPLWCGHYIIKNGKKENYVPAGVTGDTLTIPIGKDPEILEWEIYSEEGLSWFSSYVNGLNVFHDGDTYTPDGQDTIHRKYNDTINPYARAKLMNDLDMSRHLWVPIGSVTKYAGGNVGESMAQGSDIYTDDETHSYMGTFDGQGHIITGLHGQFLTGIKKYGLFGRLADTACVKNVFVDESKFITDKNDLVYHIGGIAGLVMDEAVIAGAEARTKIDSRYANPESYVGGLVGEVKGNGDKHPYIHSSMAMPEFYGGAKHVGGLVGKLGVGDTLVNSFSNPKFADSTYKDQKGSERYYYGGLVGVNDGLVENCYSRLQGREPIGDNTKQNIYGWLGGTNNAQANIKYCYAYADSIAAPHDSKYLRVGKEPVGHYSYGKTTRVNNKYGFDHRDQQIFKRDGSEQLPKPGIVSDNRFIQNGILFGLLPTLDHWVDTFAVVGNRKKDYAHWERSLASPINDDYPLLMLQDFNTLGSKDCIYIHYGNNDKLLQDYNELDDITYNPNVFIYDAAHISANNDPNVKVFIGEHVGITQAAGNNLSDVRVGVTFDNSSGNDLGHAYYDWHMFCTPLIEPPMGLIHHTGEYPNYPVLKNYDSGDLNLIAKGIPDDEAHYGARAFMDPPPTTWNTASGKIGYFPTDTPYGTNEGTRAGEKSLRDYTQGAFDFYMYGEYWHNHWINFKREGAYKNGSSFGLVSTVQDRDFFSDHWRQDAMKDASGNWVHYHIKYENEARMVPARGYMMAINEKWADLQYPDSIVRNPERHNMLMTDGDLRNRDEVYKTTFTIHDSPVQANDYDTEVRGTNLVGNPYQSYLDANKFLEANDAILSSKAYFVLDADHYGYIAYPKRASVNNLSAPDKIHPHQGFFVKVARTGDLVFTNDMRLAMKNIPKNEDTIYTFREQRLNYPLVNLICTDSDGMKDYTTVEINRPDPGDGAEKMRRLRTGNALIYARQDNKNFHVAFLPEGVSEVPVRFEPFADDEFKLTWNTLHGDFSYLHLIDNKTGVDVDCLRASEYRFTSKVGDYLSRFKLVFRCVGIDEDYEPDDPDGYNNQTIFAFQSGDEVIVNGSGHLDVFDVLGRCLLSTTLAGETNSVSLPRSSAGVYLLRLTNNKQTKVQKMVIH